MIAAVVGELTRRAEEALVIVNWVLVAPGPLLTFVVNDTTAMASYSATPKAVANRQNQLRSPLTGYELKVTP
jgi:hypothetical protein